MEIHDEAEAEARVKQDAALVSDGDQLMSTEASATPPPCPCPSPGLYSLNTTRDARSLDAF